MDMDERDTRRSTHTCYVDEHSRYKVSYLSPWLEVVLMLFVAVIKMFTTRKRLRVHSNDRIQTANRTTLAALRNHVICKYCLSGLFFYPVRN